MELIKNYEFHSGFFTGNAQVESFNNKEYICFGDYKTNKKIAFHTFNDTLVQYVSLKKIIEEGESIMGFEIINSDSIYILTYYSNKVFLINNVGEVKSRFDYNSLQSINNKYGLMRSRTPFLFNDSTFIFLLSAKYDKSYKNFKEFVIESYKKPNLIRVVNFKKDSIKTKLGLFGLYNSFPNYKEVFLNGNNYKFINKKIFFMSQYSDSLFIIDPFSLTIEKKVKISSKYSVIKIEPLTIQEYDKGENVDYTSNGRMSDIFYDKKQNIYYVFAVHKKQENTWPWSIIVLDSNLKTIDEIKMDETKYSFSGMMTSKGLLISNYYETLNDKDHFKKNTYSLFRYE